MSSFCFILTEQCDWDCEYCEFPLIQKPKHTTIETLSKHLPYIKKTMDKMGNFIDFLSVDGGELGLLPVETLEYFFKTIDHPMVVCTNGEFIRKGYVYRFRDYITEVWYHASLEETIIYIDDIIKTGIVHNDVDELIRFIIEHPYIDLDYVELEFDVTKKRDVDYSMYEKLYNNIKPLSNVSKKAKKIVESRITELRNLRKMCADYNSTIVVDLINERIPLCHRSQKSYIQLNETNFKYRLTHFPLKIYKENNCQTCTRLFANKFNPLTFSDIYELRKIL